MSLHSNLLVKLKLCGLWVFTFPEHHYMSSRSKNHWPHLILTPWLDPGPSYFAHSQCLWPIPVWLRPWRQPGFKPVGQDTEGRLTFPPPGNILKPHQAPELSNLLLTQCFLMTHINCLNHGQLRVAKPLSDWRRGRTDPGWFPTRL